MTTLVCGSRGVTDYYTVVQAILESGFHITKIISGGAIGVDKLAEKYTKEHDLPLETYPVSPDEWRKSRGAGLAQNTQIVNLSEQVIAIWDGESRGTKDSITKATKRGLLVYIHRV